GDTRAMKKLGVVLFTTAIATNALAVRISRELVLSGPVVPSPARTAAVWTGSYFATFWVQGGDIRAARISADGRLLEPSRVVWSGVSGHVGGAKASASLPARAAVASHVPYSSLV